MGTKSVRQDETESESLRLSNFDERLPIHEPVVRPRPLVRWNIGNSLSLLVDLAMLLVFCLFLVYGLAVNAYEGTPMEDSPTVKLLQRSSTLGPTIYPILFAAIVGKAMRSMAFWKLEKGGRSQIRTPSIIGITLIVVWALSPLGGQASLRTIGHGSRETTNNFTIQYVNTSSWLLSGSYLGGDVAFMYPPVNTLFGSALISQTTAQEFSRDSWGNVKIPYIEYLDASTVDKDGWIQMPKNASSDHYSSLIGLSISEITNNVNTSTSFVLDTSYWTLNCPFLGTTGLPDDTTFNVFTYKNRSGAEATASTNLYLASPSYRKSELQMKGLDLGMAPRSFTYLDNNHADIQGLYYVVANCTIETSYVDVSVNCSGRACAATKIRRSKTWHPSPHWTTLDTVNQTSFIDFAQNFVDAIKLGHAGMQTPYQGFILDPQNAFNVSDLSVSTVSNQTFSIRLGQLLNTYWMAMLAPAAIPKGPSSMNLTSDLANVGSTRQTTTSAAAILPVMVLRCDKQWLAILLLSTIVAILLGICGVLASICRYGPEPGLNVSYMIKDNPLVDSPPTSSTLDIGDRVRACKDVFVKYGDVRCEDEVGYIAIGSHGVSNLNPRRLYQ